MHIFLSLALILLPLVHPARVTGRVALNVNIENIKQKQGAVHVALYRPCADFPGCQPIEQKWLTVTDHRVNATFQAEPGEYAIAVYHDQNSNGRMDTRMFGIPKEPYGFSNNFRPRFSAPKFSDCQFQVGNAAKSISIKLN